MDNIKKEKLCVYESLRKEIISMEELQRNVWIYMYVLFCALFVLGLEWSKYLFLVTYIVLIPFQCIINDYSWSISKLSTYICVFFEEDKSNGINWESFHSYAPYIKYYREKSNTLTGIIRISSSMHLGFLASGFFCYYSLSDTIFMGKYILNMVDVIFICISLLLLFALFTICKDFNKKHSYQLRPIMEAYKNDLMGKSNNKTN